MPKYFSGTDSRILTSTGLFGNRIGYNRFKFTLSCNGETPLVKDVPITYPDGIIYNKHADIGLMFDSSHYPDGATVTVTIEAWDLYGGHYGPMSGTAPVKNKALIAEHPDGILGAETTAATLYGTNYTQRALDSASWTPTDYFSQMSGCNVVYYSGHGNVDEQAAGNYPLPGQDRMYTGAVLYSPARFPDYESERQGHMGTGLPPFNSTGQPPINFMFLYACMCGKTNNFIRAIWPYDNHYGEWGMYGPWSVNQALVDYPVEVQLQHAFRVANRFMGKMRDGYLPEDAIKAVTEAAKTETIHISKLADPIDWIAPTREDFTLWGDPNARIKSVYTYDQSAPDSGPTGWYRWL